MKNFYSKLQVIRPIFAFSCLDTSVNISNCLTEEKLPTSESSYYQDCKEYFQLTGKPLLFTSNEINKLEESSGQTIMIFGLDFDFNQFDSQPFITKICQIFELTFKDIEYKKVWKKEMICEMELFKNDSLKDKKFKLSTIYDKFTSQIEDDLATMKVFFGYLGTEAALEKTIKHRNEITLNPTYNRFYWPGTPYYWKGAIVDGKNRGNYSYFCPVGWKRYSFFVTENFDEKFSGWSICYHGTKFRFGLSILLSGLMPANDKAHKEGVYLTPSIIYASHPRYAEVRKMKKNSNMGIFKPGEYLQFVLECRARLHPKFQPKAETLDLGENRIDPNIPNEGIEWVIDNKEKTLLDFKDPDTVVVCTGVMIRRTDQHPALLPESAWWFQSNLRNNKSWRDFNNQLDVWEQEKKNGTMCNIILPD